jgi:ribonuclease VapC
MFIETSAIIAILADEPEAVAFLARIESAPRRRTGAHVRLEAAINLARILGLGTTEAHEVYDAFLAEAGITVIPITDTVSRSAVRAFTTYGKGQGHPAQLNFGDCLSYACASNDCDTILFKGRDFAKTDLASALT